jgi:predicted SAM-dependent methyltransferase
MIDIIEYKGSIYPKFQSEGFGAQYAIPYARKVCVGKGYDIGCNRLEWALPNSTPIDLTFGTDALALPDETVDYIFSSHCLEHLPNWVDALNHWTSRLRSGGTMFLYLPHRSQKYWHPWNNRKHIHSFDQDIMAEYFDDAGYTKLFISGVDLNSSFMVMAEKQ